MAKPNQQPKAATQPDLLTATTSEAPAPEVTATPVVEAPAPEVTATPVVEAPAPEVTATPVVEAPVVVAPAPVEGPTIEVRDATAIRSIPGAVSLEGPSSPKTVQLAGETTRIDR